MCLLDAVMWTRAEKESVETEEGENGGPWRGVEELAAREGVTSAGLSFIISFIHTFVSLK